MQQRNLIDQDEPNQFTYYDSTHLPPEDLKQAKLRAGSGTAIILGFFRAHRGQEFTPFEVQQRTGLRVLNSVRRAMTNLTTMGKLRKTTIRRPGKYGDDNLCWVMD